MKAAVQLGRVQPEKLQFARGGASFSEARALIRRIEDAKRVVLVQQSANPSDPSRDFARVIASVLDAEHN